MAHRTYLFSALCHFMLFCEYSLLPSLSCSPRIKFTTYSCFGGNTRGKVYGRQDQLTPGEGLAGCLMAIKKTWCCSCLQYHVDLGHKGPFILQPRHGASICDVRTRAFVYYGLCAEDDGGNCPWTCDRLYPHTEHLNKIVSVSQVEGHECKLPA